MTPVLEQLAKENEGRIRIIKVDIEQNRAWAADQKVRGIPAFQIYQSGQKVEQFTGGYPKKQLQKKIDLYADGARAQPAAPKPKSTEPAIQPMPKDWLPPGIERSKKKSPQQKS